MSQVAVQTPFTTGRPNFPKKLFYRIQEVSRITNLKPHVLRYWETEFKELAPEKDKNDQRRYRQEDIELIFQIKGLLYEDKFTIAGARQQLRKLRSQPKQEENMVAGRQAVLLDIRNELHDLMKRLNV